LSDPRYPIGKFQFQGALSEAERHHSIGAIEQAPLELATAVQGLTPEQLDTPYREGGWTVRQVVHHLPDSHMNAYVRFKLALTEEEPAIKAYAEDRWAELPDTQSTPVEVSLALLGNLHRRWVELLRSIAPGEWQRSFRHPELGLVSLEKSLAMYSWHGRHHVAHITQLRKRLNW
jgi:DinB superfamily